MKIQYSFTSELEDTQEIIYQKYNRIYNRNDLSEFHTKLKSSLINKDSLKDIEKLLTNYKDALVFVIQEVEENKVFLGSLLNSLNNVSGRNIPEVVEEEDEVVETVAEPEHSIESLSNIIDSLTSRVSDDG
jgi:hypothetical protein